MFRYEHRSDRLLPYAQFFRRVVVHAGVATVIIAGSLAAGIIGYRYTEDMAWIDALLNASMILGGMGPVTGLATPEGKVFASVYALYSGIMFLALIGIVLAPFVHRMLHRLHVNQDAGS